MRWRQGLPRPGAAWIGLLLAVLAAVAPGVHAQEVRIGFVDMQRLLDNAPQVIDARSRLAREFATRDDLLQADERRLSELEARQAQSSDPIGSEPAVRLAAEINALRRSVERTRQRLREELRARTEEEIDRAFPRLNEAVAEFARDQGYDLVLTSPVIYASGRLDITDAVLDRLRRDFQARP
jgi:outer membrane protein